MLLDGDVEDYEYLNKSRREVDGIDDREEWNLLKVSETRCLERTKMKPDVIHIRLPLTLSVLPPPSSLIYSVS